MGKGRAPCCDKSQVKRGPWSPAEDLRLMTFIQKHGHENWRALPKEAGLARCGKSCRLRWINYLRPDLKRGSFTKEEEDMIIRLQQTLGNKWSKIASYFPGRTDNEIKNVWNTHFKKKLASPLDANSGSSSNLSSSSSSSNNVIMSHDNTSTKLDLQQIEVSSTENQDFQQKDDMGDSQVDVTKQEEPEVQGTKSETEIPLESDVDFWNMLDSLSNSDNDILEVTANADQESITSNLGQTYLEEIENMRWLSYLKNELGLEDTSEGDLKIQQEDVENENEFPGDFMPANLFEEPEINSELECYYLWPSM